MRDWGLLAALVVALWGCASGDGEEPDPGPTVSPDVAVTSGGGASSTEEAHALVYVAPVRPVGELSSPNYRLRLGPAAARRPSR